MSARDPVADKIAVPFAYLIMVGWSAALADALIKNQFVPLTVVTPVVVILAGYVFGRSIVKRALSDV